MKITQYLISLCFLKTYTSVHKISFNEEDWRYYNRQGIRKQENQSDCGVLVLLNALAITNNSFDKECETVSVKWRYWALDCCLKVIQKNLDSFNSTFNKKLLETVKHDYFLQNNEITKIQGEISHEEFYDFIGSSLVKKYLLNFGAPLIYTEYVSWSSSDENSEKEDLEREKTLTQFPGKINIEVTFLCNMYTVIL